MVYRFIDMQVLLRTSIAMLNIACLELVADLVFHLQSAADMALQSGMATKPEQ